MPEYINPWPHTVELMGPAGERIRLKVKARKHLDEYYERYTARGYIERVDESSTPSNVIVPRTNSSINTPVNHLKLGSKPRVQRQNDIQQRINAHKTTPIKTPDVPQPSVKQTPTSTPKTTPTKAPRVHTKPTSNSEAVEVVPTNKGIRRQPVVHDKRPTIHKHRPGGIYKGRKKTEKQLVGKIISGDATQIYKENNAKAPYRISNGIAIGILSYNRGKSLLRLVESIKRTVDLNTTILFISDDASTSKQTLTILSQIATDSRIVVIKNSENVGISSNSNRLLRCMSRFEHMFICNDDIEFLQPGWIEFYVRGAKASGFHHFCYRQPNVYGAKLGEEKKFRNIRMNYVPDKPHGAMLYMSNHCLKKIGYFDAQYQFYGMEHVDWSMRPSEFNLQPAGFYDLVGSTEYVRIHAEATSVDSKTEHYVRNKSLFEKRIPRTYHPPCEQSVVPKISYVIPCRDAGDQGRQDSIKSVVKGVIGQSFPEIDIWLVEQDSEQRLNGDDYPSVHYLFVGGEGNDLFNKSKAFNRAVTKCTADSVILHDADMLSRVDYTRRTYDLLQSHESVHICGRVIYLNMESTNRVNRVGYVPDDVQFERIVGYFEGGSLACRMSTFWERGAFNEDFWGYGCEDCDFYTRIGSTSSWLCSTEFDLVHLWHSRVVNWNDHHNDNKSIAARLNKMTIEQRVRLQHKQLHSLGYGKYLS